MVELRLVINDVKTGKSYQTTADIGSFMNKKIGDKVSLGSFSSYEFLITGGSDDAGFPMRRDIEGVGRKRPLLSKGPGIKDLKKGQKIRKNIRGNTISTNIAQINLKILTYGTKGLEELLPEQYKKVEEKIASKKNNSFNKSINGKAEVKEESKADIKQEKAEVKEIKEKKSEKEKPKEAKTEKKKEEQVKEIKT